VGKSKKVVIDTNVFISAYGWGGTVLREENSKSVLLAKKQSNALLSLAGIGSSGLKDVSENPDKYLYGTKNK